jgi:hypothetical protein
MRVCAYSLFILAIFASGCSDETVASKYPISDAWLTVNVKTSNLDTLSNFPFGPNIYRSQQSASLVNSVTMTSAKIMIGRIRFKSVDGDSLDFRADDPVIVNLDLTGVAQRLGSVQVPSGTYDETRFRIDDLDSTAGDIYWNNPQMRDLSIRVEGFVNEDEDSSFVWTADFDEEQTYEFNPIVIQPADTVEVSFIFDTNQWYSDGIGGFLDPRDESSRSMIENNIKTIFDVREDNQ